MTPSNYNYLYSTHPQAMTAKHDHRTYPPTGKHDQGFALAFRGGSVVRFRTMSKEVAKVEFITREEAERQEAEVTERVYKDPEPYTETADELRPLTGMAASGNGVSRVHVPREVERKKVVNAFHDAFELIGGVPRLAHWADSHPSSFFKLYARLLPTQASQQIEHSGGYTVQHVLPPSPLDQEN